jgi:hypothetical protein
MYHEAFWVAVSAAAPVIALAAVVSWTEASRIQIDVEAWPNDNAIPEAEDDAAEIAYFLAKGHKFSGQVRIICIAIIVTQAVALMVGLLSLANGVNYKQSTPIVVFEVGGLLLLAWAAWISYKARSRLMFANVISRKRGYTGFVSKRQLERLVEGTRREPQADPGTRRADEKSPSQPRSPERPAGSYKGGSRAQRKRRRGTAGSR